MAFAPLNAVLPVIAAFVVFILGYVALFSFFNDLVFRLSRNRKRHIRRREESLVVHEEINRSKNFYRIGCRADSRIGLRIDCNWR